MLQTESFVPLNDFERQLFARLVPEDHFLRRLERTIDFERFRPTLAEHYAPGEGRPALDPVMMLKLDLLSIQNRWSDRELMRQAQVNMAHRLFLNLGSSTVSVTAFSQTVAAASVCAGASDRIELLRSASIDDSSYDESGPGDRT